MFWLVAINTYIYKSQPNVIIFSKLQTVYDSHLFPYVPWFIIQMYRVYTI